MDKLTPRHLTHRGTVFAEAFILSAKILTRSEIRLRALKMWDDGVRFLSLGDDLVVMMTEGRFVDSRVSPGLPLTRNGSVLTAFPLSSEALEQLSVPANSLMYYSEGRLEIVDRGVLVEEPVEAWFDLSNFKVFETESLGEPAPARVMDSISEHQVDLRTGLKNVPSADAQLSEVLAKLKEVRETNDNGGTGSLFGRSDSSNRGEGSVSRFFSSALSNLKKFFQSGQGTPDSWNARGRGDGIPSFEQVGAGTLARFYARFKDFAVRTVLEMRMGHIFGRRQAKYLMEMMEKFERGDLDEALKYAIPLEDMQALSELMQRSSTLFAPRPRKDLQIYMGRDTGGPTINLGGEWFEHLRQLYRRSFEHLEAQGRFEEAAFVLAELLKSNSEAVEFLSKHGKYRLAAELAETRNLPKDMVVRQWFLAGEKERAVRLAVLHDCFEYAVTKLEQQGSESAVPLREIWAHSLAQKGDYSGAVEVIWRNEDRRSQAKEWIEKAIEFGGVAGARMLARKTILDPESFPEIKEKFISKIQGAGPDGIQKRNAFARAVLKEKINNELRVLLRPLTRTILADARGSDASLQPGEFQELVSVTGDRTLRTDLPNFPRVVRPAADGPECFELSIASEDRGSLFIHDVCSLPEERVALALGESGVKVLNRHGKTIAYVDQPAHRLIASDAATKAIAVANRGESVRLSKIDFIDRRGEYWCDTRIDDFARNFDGNIWFVAARDEFYAVYTDAKNFEAVWRVPDIGGVVEGVARSKSKLKFLTSNERGFETWVYELPNLTLRRRTDIAWHEKTESDALRRVSTSAGACSVVIVEREDSDTGIESFYVNIFRQERITLQFALPPDANAFERPEVSEEYGAVVTYADEEARVYFFSASGRLVAKFSLGSAKHVSAEIGSDYLTIADDRGRLLVYDFKVRNLIRNERL